MIEIDAEVLIETGSWKKYRCSSEQYVRKIVDAYLNVVSLPGSLSRLEVCFLLTDASTLRALNKKFLKKDRPTNVLSFPGQVLRPGTFHKVLQQTQYLYLGDLAFAYEVILEESLEYNIQFSRHFSYLCVHGLLHTLGYNHEEEKEAAEMLLIESKIMTELKIANYLGKSPDRQLV